MLTALHIENIAIIDRINIEFDRGFSVLTGETGAGKSIIIDSIQLLLGNKASKELIRTGTEYGIVSATFCSLTEEALEILEDNGLAPDEDGNITVFRKIGIDGRNSARINGINVTVALLKQLGEHLINIHGQHDGVLLLDARRHLSYLDEFGQTKEVCGAYELAYGEVKSLRDQLNAAKIAEENKERRCTELTRILEELEACDLQAGEYDALMLRRKNLIASAEITEALHTAADSVYDGEMPAAQQVKIALDSLREIENIFPQGKDFAQRLTQISAELDDIGSELGKLFDSYVGEQMDPDQIERRLDQLEHIRKLYGPTDEKVLSFWNDCRLELEQLTNSDVYVKELEEKFQAARKKLDDCAAKLTAARIKAAQQMEKQLKEELCYLDMPNISFKIRVQDRINDRGGIRYRNDGKDDVEFFLSPNAGESLKPLAKIASGGELSRIMLSLKTVLNKGIDTVIYDEVDTGVSGATAEKIGKKLQAGAGEKQVFSITHLAQIASLADHHYKVSKSEINGRVCSEIKLLTEQERIHEIARIMGGEELTETLLRSAKELIINNKNKD